MAGYRPVTAAFGQGISTTPLQLVSAFTVIANGGLYKPYIVSQIRDGIKTVPFKPVKARQFFHRTRPDND